MRYVKRACAFIIEENPQSLFVDHLGNWFLLRGAVVEVVVRELLDYLGSPHSLEEIMERFAGRLEKADMEDALAQLVRMGVVEEYDEGLIGEEFAGIGSFLGLFTPYLEEKKRSVYFARLRKSSVLVLGEGEVANGVAKGLLSCGVTHPTEEKWPLVGESDEGKGALKKNLLLLLEGKDFVVVTGSGRALGFFLAVNEVALQKGVSVLYVDEDGTGGTVGPLVVSGETACFQCYMDRKQANKEYDGYDLMKSRVEPQHAHGGFSLFAQWLVCIAVTESVKFLSHYMYPETLRGVFLVDAVNYRVQFHPVLKSPYCAVCGYVDRIPPQRVWMEDEHVV